jgi:hypothetical protein
VETSEKPGTSTNDLRINLAVENAEARRRVNEFNKAQESVASTAERASQRATRAGQARSADPRGLRDSG